MNEVSKEVFARETHEKAKSYYNVSEQYAYKFLMEVKKIRDEKLFLELGCENFAEYTENYFGYSRNTINDRIQTADSWGEDYNRALGLYGKHKTRQLGLLPTKERENLIENGVPTETGVKTIDEVTTREIEEYKRQLKAKDEQIDNLSDVINDMSVQQPEVVEKEIVIEKIPDDYNYFKGNYEATKKNYEFFKEQNSQLRDEIKSLEDAIKRAPSHEEVNSLQEQLSAKQERELSINKIYEFQEAIEQFTHDHSSILYSNDLNRMETDRELLISFEDSINHLIEWAEEVKKELPNKNIIEGDVL